MVEKSCFRSPADLYQACTVAEPFGLIIVTKGVILLDVQGVGILQRQGSVDDGYQNQKWCARVVRGTSHLARIQASSSSVCSVHEI